jgi:hypothetical protein
LRGDSFAIHIRSLSPPPGDSLALAANSELQRTNKTLLFCPPPNFSMTAEEVNAFLDKFITNHKDRVKSSDFIGVLLLGALKETYPCPE